NVRIRSTSAASGYPTSIRIPPVKSMPKLSPRAASRTIEISIVTRAKVIATVRGVRLRKSIDVFSLIHFIGYVPVSGLLLSSYRHTGHLAPAVRQVHD